MALEARTERDNERGVVTAFFRVGEDEWFAEFYIDGAEAFAHELLGHVTALRANLEREIEQLGGRP